MNKIIGFEDYKKTTYKNNKAIVTVNSENYRLSTVRVECNECHKTIDILKHGFDCGARNSFYNKRPHVYRCRDCAVQHYNVGSNSCFWKGGRHINNNGYVMIAWKSLPLQDKQYIPQDYASPHYPEHRIMMAKHVKRVLAEDEIVHHIDGNKTNNEIDNLELVNVHEHHAITILETRMEQRIKDLEEENAKLREQLFELVD